MSSDPELKREKQRRRRKRRRAELREMKANRRGLGGVPQSEDETVMSREDLALVARAVRERWSLTNDIRDEVLQEVLRAVREAPTWDHKLAAARTLGNYDLINVRREQHEASERPHEVDEVLQALRVKMRGVEAREIALRVTEVLCNAGQVSKVPQGPEAGAKGGLPGGVSPDGQTT